MRKVKITKAQFDDVLYPTLATSSCGDVAELEVAVRVMRKLNLQSTPAPLTDAEKKAAEGGATLRPHRRLLFDEHTFEFEEDEYRLMIQRLTASTSRTSMAFAEELATLMDTVKNAVTVRP